MSASTNGSAGSPGRPAGAAALPRLDLHVHLDNSSIGQVLPLARERGVTFGIVEHAGTKENLYPVVLSNDAELKAYVEPLAAEYDTFWTDRMIHRGDAETQRTTERGGRSRLSVAAVCGTLHSDHG